MDRTGGPTQAQTPESGRAQICTGIEELDRVCNGGLPAEAAYLIRGGPGSGKTTLCLQFLAEGVKQGAPSLFISLGEPERQLRRNAPAALELAGIEFLDLSPSGEAFSKEQAYDIFSSADVEGEPLIDAIRGAIERLNPSRVAVDSMSHLRYLASDGFQYRKQVLGLLRLMTEQGATVLFTSESMSSDEDTELSFLSDGVIALSTAARVRRLGIPKLRGTVAQPGPHTYTLGPAGLDVSPRLQAGEHSRRYWPELVTSGVAGLDDLCGGGFHRGTTTVISGPSGVGKSNIGMLYMKDAAARGERSVIVNFEESREMVLQRSRSINVPIDAMLDKDMIAVHTIEPLSHSPDDLAKLLRVEVEEHGAKVVMLDSLGSFQMSVAGDDDPRQLLHELCRYLGNMGVTMLLIHETEEIVGAHLTAEHFSYLTDNILLLRYIQHENGLGRVLGLLKKRTGSFQRHPLRFSITSSGIRVHENLESIEGIIPGLPSSSQPQSNAPTHARDNTDYQGGNGHPGSINAFG